LRGADLRTAQRCALDNAWIFAQWWRGMLARRTPEIDGPNCLDCHTIVAKFIATAL
jgi:hypothetical protein